jgi:hypothetical protein
VQAAALRAAFRRQRLRTLRALREGPWTTLAMTAMTPGPRPGFRSRAGR